MTKHSGFTRFQPTKHPIERLQLRFYPDLSDEKAADLLRKIAKGARPLKVRVGRN